MKTNIKKELHLKSINELRVQLKDAIEEQRTLKLDHTMGKVKNTSEIGNKSNEIAVVSTIINEKIIAEKVKDASVKKGGAK